MRVVRARQPAGPSETMRPHLHSMPGSTVIPPGRVILWARRAPVRGACTTRTEMSGSGAPIGLAKTIMRNLQAWTRLAQIPGSPAFFGAGPGATGRSAPGLPSAPYTIQRPGTTTSVFGWPGLCSGRAFGPVTVCGLTLYPVQPTSTGAEMPGRFTKDTRFARQVPSRNLEKVYQNGHRPLEIGRHEGKGRTARGPAEREIG